jgi:hypothetical protein
VSGRVCAWTCGVALGGVILWLLFDPVHPLLVVAVSCRVSASSVRCGAVCWVVAPYGLLFHPVHPL